MLAATDWLFPHGDFLGISWNLWKFIGWAGNAIFFSRFLVQWYATEKRRQVVVPVAFWWLSILGSWMLLLYALFYRKDSVFVLANAFNWIPYVRNLMIHKRHQRELQICPSCEHSAASAANFCSHCGLKFEE